MKTLLKILLLTVATYLCSVFSSTHAATNLATADNRYRVMMILYRGVTDAERGFMNYFAERKIPVEFIIRDTQEDMSQLPSFIKEIKETKPDLVYTFGTSVTAAIVGTTDLVNKADYVTNTPIVFNVVADPIGAKIAADMKSSGRNVTGVSHVVPMRSQLKAITSIKKFARLGVIYNPREPNAQLAVKALSALASEFNYMLDVEPVKPAVDGRPDDETLHAAINALITRKPDAIFLPSDSFIIANAHEVTSAALAAKIPVYSATEAPIRVAGAFAGLVSTYYNVGRFAGYKAEEILVHGKPVETIPMETLNRFTFLVNMRVAKALDVYPPISVMQMAEVIRY